MGVARAPQPELLHVIPPAGWSVTSWVKVSKHWGHAQARSTRQRPPSVNANPASTCLRHRSEPQRGQIAKSHCGWIVRPNLRRWRTKASSCDGLAWIGFSYSRKIKIRLKFEFNFHRFGYHFDHHCCIMFGTFSEPLDLMKIERPPRQELNYWSSEGLNFHTFWNMFWYNGTFPPIWAQKSSCFVIVFCFWFVFMFGSIFLQDIKFQLARAGSQQPGL